MGKRGIFYGVLLLVIVSGLVLVQSINSEAGVKGPCSDCHTMHNSQNGGSVNEVGGEAIDAQSYLITGADLSSGANPCLGCHKKNDSGGYFQDPQKQQGDENTDAPQVNVDPSSGVFASAAGTYYFVTSDQTEQGEKSCSKGHNVVGMGNDNDNEDPLLGTTPPGGTDECLGGAGKQLTCAGTSGCHGNRTVDDPLAAIKGGHHSSALNDYQGRYRDGNSVATSYRMLLGVRGRVAKNWEHVDPASTDDNLLTLQDLVADNKDVNVYQGSDSKLSGTMTDPGEDHSINSFCGECHGNAGDNSEKGFHSLQGLKGKGSTSTTEMDSPWKRHPTDMVMKQDDQYGGYPGIAGKDYSLEVPVGFPSITRNGGTNELQKSQRVVLCVSCHRAHGSQYNDALRWDYTEIKTTSTDGSGCFRCHTNKYAKQ